MPSSSLPVGLVGGDPVTRIALRHLFARLDARVVEVDADGVDAGARLTLIDVDDLGPRAAAALLARDPRAVALTVAGSPQGVDPARVVFKPLRLDGARALLDRTRQALDVAAAFDAACGEPELLAELLDDYLELSAPLQHDLADHLRAHRFDDVGRLAHRLAGNLGLVGALEAGAAARRVDEAVRTGDLERARLGAMELDRLLSQVAEDVRALRATLPPRGAP
jgi:HPt (histidine-containing phosphotransfer) domain-containing protein